MKKNKDLGLEGLRGIACLVVAIGHFAFVFFPYLASLFHNIPGAVPRFEFEKWATIAPISLAYSAEAAVCVFFVMSGYVLTTKFFATGELGSIQKAASKRYIRLVLPSFASVALAWTLWKTGAIITNRSLQIGVAGWFPGWYAEPFQFISMLTNGLVGAPLFAHTQLNPPLWTIQVELIGSILLFAMLALFGRHPVLLVGWFIFFADVLGFQSTGMLFYLSFFAGALLNLAQPWLQRQKLLLVIFMAAGLTGLAFNLSPQFGFLQAIPLPNFRPTAPNLAENPRVFWNTIGAILLVAGVIGSSGTSRLLGSRIPVFLGKISFSVYIIHVPLLMSVGLRAAEFSQAHGATYGQSAAIAFGLYIVAVFVVGSVFQRFIDAPAIKLADFVGSGRKITEMWSRIFKEPA